MQLRVAVVVRLVIVLAFCCSPALGEMVRPNIVMVLIDDMGWGDLSCFGNTHARTPHVDRLAAEGICLSQFYVNAPICSPSRCALTTGQYPQRWRTDRKSWPQHGLPAQPDLAVRDGDWKLLCQYDGSRPKLYDLAHDRGETTNVAARHPEVVTRLTAAVLQWHRSMSPDNGPALAEAAAGQSSAPVYPDKMNLMLWLDAQGKEHSVRNAQDWLQPAASSSITVPWAWSWSTISCITRPPMRCCSTSTTWETSLHLLLAGRSEPALPPGPLAQFRSGQRLQPLLRCQR